MCVQLGRGKLFYVTASNMENLSKVTPLYVIASSSIGKTTCFNYIISAMVSLGSPFGKLESRYVSEITYVQKCKLQAAIFSENCK